MAEQAVSQTPSEAPKVIIMAGGTGGHIFPGLATARELIKQGYRVHWLGTPGSMEAELVPGHGIDISFIPVTGLRGKGLSFLLQAPWRLAVSLFKAVRVLREHRPVCVVGMGGYVTGPGGVAARLLGIPLVVHEQNAVAGLTNKLLARIATRVLEAFPGTFAGLSSRIARKVVLTGNPVRPEIVTVPAHLPRIPLRLLVVGGSRGALAINQMIPRVLQNCGAQIDVWHQTGKGTFEQCLADYQQLGVSGRVEPFIDDMAQAYEWADLVICRSGALTIAELAAAGKPGILVPFPFAVDDHQTVNGRYLVDRGAALMVQQKDLNVDSLTNMILKLADNPEQLERMASSARTASLPQATDDVVRLCLEAAGKEVSYA
ncbi:undecaprenyldiphospho-muramoylpentapeptide beta-N-acetylglucosaminyltransferase [Endozoicomonas sp. GU-1]|uniref:undecaprenyldiphospho-muramoylpentapeptide beta-N-acetylglucosaminyltransferase n=2 Tax=unclassified Endozoicomonas TaxID=2644528 RepID=UPI0022B55162|nr:undecaprenyldiphospho-muramoylpentapeptide beta-N-acetylglucosaminyltransferase [Endozoicomonas sp. GU-1]WBA80231.1 undecaprenyldiphospho-muramoylpentapeptide beta-N-acetylglucosaminyltransferase [Endozoicomonas sp. GU-1]WBA87806.1 undecaprenyldiphospho-muramoylpentapeptide beta-N-acetylglucosaminyltransferase [Endozoicomonas sp. GU-1]